MQLLPILHIERRFFHALIPNSCILSYLRLRDRALFDLAIDSKLRGCDLVKIKIGTLVSGPEIRKRALVVQQKTGRPAQFELMADARASLLAWLERRVGTIDDYAFPSRIDHSSHMSTRQYARLVDE